MMLGSNNMGAPASIDIDFLKKIIPNGGALIMTQIKNGRAINIPCSDFDAMGEQLSLTDMSGFDAYHACASFQDSTSRTARNAKFHKALFLDLDCGEDKAQRNEGYATKNEALVALKVFGKLVSLPKPMTVDSGGGIHVYWPFQTAVPTANWKAAAEGLKSLCKSHGLLADRQVTADAARILRPVGSHNRKYEAPRPVKLINDADCVDFESIKAIIDAAVNRFETAETSMNNWSNRKLSTTESLGSLAEQVNPNGYSLGEVEDALKLLNPECPRSEWLPVGMAIADAFGETGRDLFLKWSRGDLRETNNGAQ